MKMYWNIMRLFRKRSPTKVLVKRVIVIIVVIYCLRFIFSPNPILNDTFHILLKHAITRVETENVIYPSEKYIFIPNIIIPENGSFIDPTVGITLCSQSSIENLHYIRELAEIWNGDISLTVFSYGDQTWTSLHYMMLLHKCYPAVQQHVRFHLVYPISHPPTTLWEVGLLNLECTEVSFSKFTFTNENYILSVEYPVNVARNIAMMYMHSPFVFNLDIDMVPSPNLKARMEDFLRRREETDLHKNILYVIPSFERRLSAKGSTKLDIIQGYKNGSFRQFYKVACVKCHRPTDYTAWMSMPPSTVMEIAYSVTFTDMYEPFYIAERKLIPGFCSLFKGFGKNRYSQVYEAHIMGLQFSVMNNAFVTHDGFKNPEHQSFEKRQQSRKNEQIFKNVFKPLLHLESSDSNITSDK